jgi:membrane protein
MWQKIKRILKIFYDAGYQTVHDDGIEHAGYLAFLGLLSMFPSLIFLFSIAADIGNKDYGVDFLQQIYAVLPSNVVSELKPTINQILSGPPQGLLTIAIIGVIWTASGAVEGFRTILNRVYRVKNPPHYLFRRALSIVQFILLSFIIIIGMFFITIIPSFVAFIHTRINFGLEQTLTSIRFYISALALFIGVALGYYILPNIKQNIIRVMPGAMICVILWLAVIEVFTNYVAYYHRINAVYGSLAGIVITLVFFYVMSVIYIYGAEFNYFLERYLGHDIREKE